MCETNEKTFLMRSDFFFCKWIYFFREFFFTNFFFTFGFSRHFWSTQKSYIFSWRGKIFHLVLHRNLQTNLTQLDEVHFFRILFFFTFCFSVFSAFFHVFSTPKNSYKIYIYYFNIMGNFLFKKILSTKTFFTRKKKIFLQEKKIHEKKKHFSREKKTVFTRKKKFHERQKRFSQEKKIHRENKTKYFPRGKN